MILEGEIKDAKMSSFLSYFQTLIKQNFLCIFFMIINKFEKTNSKAFFKNILNENLVAF